MRTVIYTCIPGTFVCDLWGRLGRGFGKSAAEWCVLCAMSTSTDELIVILSFPTEVV